MENTDNEAEATVEVEDVQAGAEVVEAEVVEAEAATTQRAEAPTQRIRSHGRE